MIEMTTEKLKSDISHIIMRIQTGKNVEPIEIHNEFIGCINYITTNYKNIEDGYVEMIPKNVLHTMTNLWITLDKYRNSLDAKRNRIGDHNAAYHISQLNFLLRVVDNLETIDQKIKGK